MLGEVIQQFRLLEHQVKTCSKTAIFSLLIFWNILCADVSTGCAFALLGAEVADWVINWRSCHHSFCDAKDKLCFAPTMREAPCCNTSKWLRFVVVICFALVTIVIEPGKKISVVTHIAGLAYGFFIGLLVTYFQLKFIMCILMYIYILLFNSRSLRTKTKRAGYSQSFRSVLHFMKKFRKCE